MSNLDQMLKQIDDLEDELIALEQALVKIPSVNTGFMPTGDETPVCNYISGWLSAVGIDSEILESSPNRGNIIANIEGSSGKL